MSHVRLENLSKDFGSGPVVDRLTLEVPRGEFLGLLGPSGCGKTTTLRMLAGLLAPSDGRIAVGGRDVTPLASYRRNMGFVFQNYALFPHLNVAENVAFGLEMRRVDRAERQRRVAEALELVRLTGLEKRRPRELSGGQQQRVALARALVIRPDVLLLDESLSNLDAKLREQMRLEIREIQKTLAITTLFVTHDQIEALSMCDRVALLDRGRLAQVGTPEEVYERPANRFVANFVGRINVIAGRAAGDGTIVAGGIVLRGASPTQVGPVEILVRPHRIALAPGSAVVAGLDAVSGTVARVVYVGDIVQISLDTPAGRILAERGTAGEEWRRYRPGEAATACWDPRDALVFAPGA